MSHHKRRLDSGENQKGRNKKLKQQEEWCFGCRKKGHSFGNCSELFENNATGVIVAMSGDQPKFLMVCRKDTHHYVQLIKGDYELRNLSDIVAGISKQESENIKQAIAQSDFSLIWNSVFMNENTRRKLAKSASQAFRENATLINDLLNDTEFVKKLPDTPEWQIPKGKPNYGEDALGTALRELQEETGYTTEDIELIRADGIPVTLLEEYVDPNFRLSGRAIPVKRTYFLARSKIVRTTVPSFANDEVSALAWKSAGEVESLFGCTMHTGAVLRRAVEVLETQ
eukprot:Phypoly_transcript_14374.p1 GENE.Phypoly_transcript_14374~~Phypoly_transcript_14374.p1  ORF type:complete len:284 (+),score=35.21 Phypoly_transcript_14374:133-984(+)